MNNDELKKKICEIIAPYVSAWGEDERIADALIAAGIGDVKEAEQRAEKAERALSNELVQQGIRIGVFDVRTWYYQALERAEKELAEERKDD